MTTAKCYNNFWMFMTLSSHRDKKLCRAFSLLELMVVMSIMAGVMTLTVPLTAKFMRSNQLNTATGHLGGMIEEARNQALARQSYIWLGLTMDSVRKGTWVALFDSGKTATSSSSEVRLVSKPVFLQGVTLRQVSELSSMDVPVSSDPATADLLTVTGSADAPIFTPIQTKVGAMGNFSFDRLILFSPRGEALARQNTLSRWIVIGMAPESLSGSNAAVFQISGLTAQCTTHRP